MADPLYRSMNLAVAQAPGELSGFYAAPKPRRAHVVQSGHPGRAKAASTAQR